MSAATYPKRLIEVDLPIKEISAHARREKSIRQGHISTLHMWWARRPLAACRAVLCASLWPDPADEHCPQTFRDVAAQTLVEFADTVRTNKELAELCTAHWPKWRAIDSTLLRAEDAATWLAIRQALLDFIADFANWSASGVPAFLKVAQTLTETAHRTLLGPLGPAPLVVDPFAGGGSIPLEALRIGADAFATDLNPIPVLLNRVTLEIAPRNGIRLAAEVRRLAPIMRAAAERKLARFYARGPKGEVPIAYLWARTISCEGPGCGAEIPLLQTFWLARKAGRSVALVVKPGPDRKSLALEVDEHAKGDQVHTPTTQRGSAICPLCGFTTPAKSVRAQLSRLDGGSADARLTAVVWKAGKETVYREPTATDVASVRDAAVALQSVDELLLPSEPTPDNSGHRAVGSPFIYGMRRWRDLYTPRQLLCLTTYVTLVRELPAHTVEQRAVRILLALAMSKMADYASSLSTWRIQRSCVRGTFSRQALGFTWDFGEMNPFGESASDFVEGCEYVAKVVEQVALAVGAHVGGGGTGAALADATRHPLPDDSAAAFITDPPYYDSVPYAEISDFFYVWLKRTLGDQVHDLFGGTLTPKAEQAIVWHPGSQTEADGFLKKMAGAMSEGRRVVHPAGIGVVIFAHKSTSGWEAQLNAMISAGWIITASWPLDTERGGRFNAQDTASLTSSVHIVCRPRENPDGSLRNDAVGSWRSVLAELPTRIHDWMPRLASEGVVGADAIFACLGPALEIFSRYARVEKSSGETVALKEYLEHVWAAVAREALSLMFDGADASGLEEDARLTAMWLWTLGAGKSDNVRATPDGETDDEEDGKHDGDGAEAGRTTAGFALEFDAARKIAQGLGAHLEKLTGVIEVRGDKARLLSVVERAKSLFSKDPSVDETPTESKAKTKPSKKQLGLFAEIEAAEREGFVGKGGVPKVGATTLDRVHQAMILFGAGRSEALKRFVVEEGVGKDARFWKLAQSLSALYPSGTDEKRWVDGVLARKKSLGF